MIAPSLVLPMYLTIEFAKPFVYFSVTILLVLSIFTIVIMMSSHTRRKGRKKEIMIARQSKSLPEEQKENLQFRF